MSWLKFYFPSSGPACDFSRLQQVHILLAFMSNIVHLSSGVPTLMAFIKMMLSREQITHSSVFVWRTVKILAN
jgi:hypothetical protein